MARLQITREHFNNGQDMHPGVFAEWCSTIDELFKARTRYLLILLAFIMVAFLLWFVGGTLGNSLSALSLMLGLVIAGSTTHTIRLNKDQKRLQKLSTSQMQMSPALGSAPLQAECRNNGLRNKQEAMVGITTASCLHKKFINMEKTMI